LWLLVALFLLLSRKQCNIFILNFVIIFIAFVLIDLWIPF
jgi:hypothetical protein